LSWISRFPSSRWAEIVINCQPNTASGRALMRTVTVRLPGARFSAAMAAMREWLDSNRYEPMKFKYDQDDEDVVVSVEFPNDQEGEAFAGRFNRKEPAGPTLPGL
jgi:hypothetical protein